MEKILIIQLCRLGDVVQTLPLLHRLKEFKEGCHISFVCREEFADIVQSSQLADRVIFPPHEYLEETIPELEEEYDFVINVTADRNSSRICYLVKGKKKTGRITTDKEENRILGNFAKYYFSFSDTRAQNLFNIVDMYIGMGEIPYHSSRSFLKIGEEEYNEAGRLLQIHGYEKQGKLIAFQLGANKRHRAWPIENFSCLAEELVRDNAEIVILGTEKERHLAEVFLMQCNVPVIDLVGKTSVSDMAAVLKHCNLLISHDTGTVHIASAVNTKILGLYFSSAYFTETAPYGAHNIILQTELPCCPCHEKGICDTITCRDYLTVPLVKNVADMMIAGKDDWSDFDFENVSVYTSMFLSNGTLIYVPMGPTISEHYQTGFLHRLLWESALGIEHDISFLEKFMPRIKILKGLSEKTKKCEEDFSFLHRLYSKGIQSADRILSAFDSSPIDQECIIDGFNELRDIEFAIAQQDFNPGIIKDFYSLEMLDLNYNDYPQLARQLAHKFRKLEKITENFLEDLSSFFL
ncbi:MAG: glycosyltransferase family 9 protein [bacterium]